MHSVYIGIGGHYYFVVSQSVEAVFDVQCGLKQVELFVFIYKFFCFSKTVVGLA